MLLAQDMQGWRNLLKLSSDAFINGFYYKPRMDKSTLAEWNGTWHLAVISIPNLSRSTT